MKNSLAPVLATLLLGGLAVCTSGCIYVRVEGDLRDGFLDEDPGGSGLAELSQALDGCLVDPRYDLKLRALPWRTSATWSVGFADEGSDVHSAFRNAREAVLQRISRESGTLQEQREEGPHAWSCSFLKEGEPGEASVRLLHDPERLEVHWSEAD